MTYIYICLTEILEQKHLKLSGYLNQIYSCLATLSALQRFAFSWTLAAKATQLQELAVSDCQLTPKIGHLQKTKLHSNPRYSPDLAF